MSQAQAIELTEEQIEYALEYVIDLKKIDKLHQKLGFKSRLAFHRYIQSHPEFEKQMDEAKRGACRYLEDDLLYVNDDHDPKAARVALEAISRMLVYLNPAKYSQKIDLNVNQTISIRSNLDASNKRLSGLVGLKDVTPAQLDPAQLVSFELPLKG